MKRFWVIHFATNTCVITIGLFFRRHLEGSKIKRWMSEAVTPFERIATMMPKEAYNKLMSVKESTDPFNTNAKLKRKVRQMFGYFKNSIPTTQWGKIVL